MRKIIQIAAAQTVENQLTQCEYAIFALCDDGTLWETNNRRGGWPRGTEPGWAQMGPIPEIDAPQLLVTAQYILEKHESWQLDHGCNECVPNGPLTHLKPGFICYYHRALKLVRPPQPESPTEADDGLPIPF